MHLGKTAPSRWRTWVEPAWQALPGWGLSREAEDYKVEEIFVTGAPQEGLKLHCLEASPKLLLDTSDQQNFL